MKYFDKQAAKWQKSQDLKQSDWYQEQMHRKARRRTLDIFAINHIDDKEWWKALSWDERTKVYDSYENTLSHAKMKFKGEDLNGYWYSYDPDIADVSGNDWKECVPQWLKYVQNKYPLDANVRRELTIHKILSK